MSVMIALTEQLFPLLLVTALMRFGFITLYGSGFNYSSAAQRVTWLSFACFDKSGCTSADDQKPLILTCSVPLSFMQNGSGSACHFTKEAFLRVQTQTHCWHRVPGWFKVGAELYTLLQLLSKIPYNPKAFRGENSCHQAALQWYLSGKIIVIFNLCHCFVVVFTDVATEQTAHVLFEFCLMVNAVSPWCCVSCRSRGWGRCSDVAVSVQDTLIYIVFLQHKQS